MTPSFSSIYRAMACGWEFRSDAEHSPPSATDGTGNIGSALHTACLSKHPKPLDEVCKRYGVDLPELKLYVDTLNEGLVKLEQRTFETAYAYDPKKETARVLGFEIEREYEAHGLAEGEVPGTTDVEYVDNDTLVVADVKSGFADHVESVAENHQLLAGMLCSMLTRNWSGPMRVELWFVRPGRIWVESATVTIIELWDFAARFRDRLRMLPVIAPTPGDHCRYCSSLGCCPATKEQMGAIIEAGAHGWTSNIVSAQHAAWMAERLPMLRKAIETVKEALETYADQIGGIPLSDGKVWRPVLTSRSSLNTSAVKERLADEIDRYMVTNQIKQYRAVKK